MNTLSKRTYQVAHTMNKEFDKEVKRAEAKMLRDAYRMNKEFDKEVKRAEKLIIRELKADEKMYADAYRMNEKFDKPKSEKKISKNEQRFLDLESKIEKLEATIVELIEKPRLKSSPKKIVKELTTSQIEKRIAQIENNFLEYDGDIIKDINCGKFGELIKIESRMSVKNMTNIINRQIL